MSTYAVRAELRAVQRVDIGIEVPERFARVPDAVYKALCTGYEIAKVFGGLRIFCHFRITEGEYQGVKLFRSFPVKGHIRQGKGPGSGPRYRLHRRAELYRTLCRVLNLPAQTKAHSVWPRELVNKLCAIKTRTVTVDYKQLPLPAGEVYSVVDEIISCEAG